MFISLEGIEGSGKSTLSGLLKSKIEAEFQREVICTREPGATELGKKLRELLLSQDEYKTTEVSELMMFAADRAQHVAEVLKPNIEKGNIVLSDRYVHSTLAYQGYGRKVSLQLLKDINTIACNGVLPDLVLLLDLEVSIGLARAKSRGESGWTSFEKETIDFHQRIRDGFLEMQKEEPARFVTLDASRAPEAIAEEAFSVVKGRLEN